MSSSLAPFLAAAALAVGAARAQDEQPVAEPTAPPVAEAATADAAGAEAPPDPVLQALERLDHRLDGIEGRLDALEGRTTDALDVELSLDEADQSDAVSWTGAVEVPAGTTVQDAMSYAGPVVVRGVVEGDAVSMAGDVRVASTGRVEGDAVSFGGKVEIEPGGEVLGDRVAFGAPGSAVRSLMAPPVEGGVGDMLHDLARRVALLLSCAGAGVLVVGFWPGRVRHVALLVAEKPFWYGVAGAILTAMLGLVSLLLTFTVVGIPIAALVMMILAVGWLLGVVGLCQAVGDRFALTRERGAWASFLAGAALIAAIGVLPWVGTLLMVLVGLPAVGAALVSRFGSRRDPDVI